MRKWDRNGPKLTWPTSLVRVPGPSQHRAHLSQLSPPLTSGPHAQSHMVCSFSAGVESLAGGTHLSGSSPPCNRTRARRSGWRTSRVIHDPPLLGIRGVDPIKPTQSSVSPLHLTTVAENTERERERGSSAASGPVSCPPLSRPWFRTCESRHASGIEPGSSLLWIGSRSPWISSSWCELRRASAKLSGAVRPMPDSSVRNPHRARCNLDYALRLSVLPPSGRSPTWASSSSSRCASSIARSVSLHGHGLIVVEESSRASWASSKCVCGHRSEGGPAFVLGVDLAVSSTVGRCSIAVCGRGKEEIALCAVGFRCTAKIRGWHTFSRDRLEPWI
jgi:hypothetical protein